MNEGLNCVHSQRMQERLTALLEVTNRFVTKLELLDLLREVTASSREVMQCDSAAVVLPDPQSGELLLYSTDSTRPKRLYDDRHFAPIAERVLETGRPFHLSHEEIGADPALVEAGIQSCCRLPLTSRARVLGVLGLDSSRDDAFVGDEASFLGLVSNQIALAVENAIAYREISRLKDRLSRENVYLQSEVREELHFDNIIGASEALRRVMREVETVAPTDSTVLIYGETGTGKELIARAVHNLSSRKPHAFVKLNCAAIPLDLLESELFGHERGAFTGAIAQKIGRFELANKGTLFLDEVGDIPAALQPKLLRVLQEQEFERLGSNRTHQVDVRLVAATNRNLAEMVKQGEFRSDLYYRLDVFPVLLPPLRARREDIPALVAHFLEIVGCRMRRQIDYIPRETMSALCAYDWPGNIRELQNRIERAVILSKDGVLSNPLPMPESPSINSYRTPTTLKEVERTTILSALEDRGWVVGGSEGAAAKLGLPRTTLIYKMERFGICRPVATEAALG